MVGGFVEFSKDVAEGNFSVGEGGKDTNVKEDEVGFGVGSVAFTPGVN